MSDLLKLLREEIEKEAAEMEDEEILFDLPARVSTAEGWEDSIKACDARKEELRAELESRFGSSS